MATDRRTAVQLLWGRLTPGAADVPADGELLGAFAATRSEADFATLLARHGRMVLGVCRRLLGNAADADADDAFQAVFLVLSRRAAALRGLRSVAGWLHGTAVRVALKARTREARRRARERKAARMRPTDTTPDWDDLGPVLDGELARLAAHYRDPVMLCCVEGRSREEAARLLGWPEGTVNGRLARAKVLLRDRLTRRGVVCPAAALTTLLSARGADAVPAELARATLAAVGGAVPPAVAALAAEPRIAWGWQLAVAVVGLAVTSGVLALGGQPPPPTDPPPAPTPAAMPVRLAHGSAVLAVGVAADGSMATVGPGSEVRVWKADGTPAARCAFPGGGSAVAFAPNGKLLAAAGYDGEVRVWDAATGARRHTFTGHGGAARAVAFSPDGSRVATGGEDGRVHLWDAATGRSLRTLDGHRGSVWGLAFAPDGRELASAGSDQSVRIWHPDTGAARTFGGLRGGAYAVEYHPTGRTLAVAADNTVRLLAADSGREVGRVGTARTAVSWFAFAPDGRSLAYRDGKAVRLWDVAAGADRLSLALPAEPAAVACTADGRALVIAAGDGAAVWDIRRHARPVPPADSNDHWAQLGARDGR